MKITPVAPGTAANPTLTNTGASSESKARAVAKITGATITQQEQVQEDRGQTVRPTLKMRTQVSPDRPIEQEMAQEIPEEQEQIANSHSNEGEASKADEMKPLSPQAAAIVKARRALQLERAALEKEKAEIATQKQGVNPDLAQYVSKADLKSKGLSILLENGVTYDELTEQAINGVGNSEILELKTQLKSLKDELTEQLERRDKNQEQQALAQIRRDVDSLVQSSPDYKAIQRANAQKDVVDLIHRTYKSSGEVLDTQEALQLVEKQIREEAMPFVDLLRPESPSAEVQEQQAMPAQPQTRVMRTLTNRDGARQTSSDKRARAIAAFYGQKG